jgi:hypothetical protein
VLHVAMVVCCQPGIIGAVAHLATAIYVPSVT